jgi:hypothetical protein
VVDEAVGAVVLGAEEEKETLETPMVPKDVNDASVNTALMSSLRPVDRVAAAALDVVVSSDSTCTLPLRMDTIATSAASTPAYEAS